ncbi:MULTISPECIES: RDD family protein [Nocardioides]|uniref:RDD family protein n=1 Tax=Nocardioides vastitatis TaxID=2568655 RepID=A0ABW0ZJC8_9ACTN|nr:RDD family protein [Nocardioides sp.]THI94815.1 RDD family protein [Nocardioides sp.]
MSYNEPPPPPPGGPGGLPPQGGFGGAPQPGAPAGVPRPAELLNRFLARLIDHVLIGVVVVVSYVVLSSILLSFTNSFLELFLFWTLQSVVGAVIPLAYFGLMESNTGQTVGKMVLKLRTYGPDGVSKPTLEQALKRNAYSGLYILGIIPFIGWFVLYWAAPIAAAAYIAVTLNNDQPNHQGWHDKFAGGTRVLQVG